MNSVPSLEPDTALDDVRRAFVHWRSKRNRRGHTPEALRQRAVGLLDQHGVSHVCQALGINASALKHWAGTERNADTRTSEFTTPPSFVALDVEPSSRVPDNAAAVSVPALTVELPEGIRVHCDSVPRAAELLAAIRRHPTTAHER